MIWVFCPRCDSEDCIERDVIEWYGWVYHDMICQGCGFEWEEHEQGTTENGSDASRAA